MYIRFAVDREANLNARGYSVADEKRILDALGRGLLKEFPNPDRKDFSELREVREVRRRRILFAIAASILVTLGIADWALVRRHNETEVAQTAVIDLRDYSVSRGPEPNPVEQPLELHRGFSQLKIYLPPGSPEGTYDLRIVTTSGDSLLNAGGTAQLNDGVIALQVRGNVYIARPGQYILQIRKAPSAWNSYPLVLR